MIAEGRTREVRQDWDAALELYKQALSADPAEPSYRMAAERARFQAAQGHLDAGLKLRSGGRLASALIEFQRAWATNPGSSAAEQEIRRTQEMIQREQALEKTSSAVAAQRFLTPAQLEKRRIDERIAMMLPPPELKALNPQAINVYMNNTPKVLFETVGKLAGLNVLFDPEYTATKGQTVDIKYATLEQALDYLAVVTKSFWRPLSPNAIFVTNDSMNKRREYEEQVLKVFYLTNPNTPQELQEILMAVRGLTDIPKLSVYNTQNAIIARGEADRIALAEKIIADLDKPRSEVVIDVVVMSTTTGVTQNLAATLANGGINTGIIYNPRDSIRAGTTTSATDSSGNSTQTASTAIPLSNIGKWATSDYAVTLPDGLLKAVLNDRSTRVLQSPQLRSVENQKATLRIGDRQPTATGSFQPGVGGVGINPLVNTQFQFIDVGVNLDLTPTKVHDNDEVSMHVELEISSVRDHVNLGGIDQPVISQEKGSFDIRLRDGQVNLLAGLNQRQDSKTVVGIPGLSSIPILGKLFSAEAIDKSQSELLIAFIPHIIRRPERGEQNLRGIAVGNATVVKLNYAPRKSAEFVESATLGDAAASEGRAESPSPGAQPATTPESSAGSQVMVAGELPPAPSTPAPQPQAAAVPSGNVRVTFVPGQLDTTVGASITVSLVMENAMDLQAAPMQIKFDPKVLRLSNVVKGELLGVDPKEVIFIKNICNDSGGATVDLNRVPGLSGVTGSGTLVTMSFQAMSRGVTTVTVPQFAPRDTQRKALLTASPLIVVTVK